MDNLEIGQSGGYVNDRLFEFFEDSLRRVSKAYIAWLILAGFLALVVYYFWSGSPLGSVQPSLFVYYLIIVVHVVFRFKTGGKANILAPEMLFLVLYTVFHLGYVSLYGLGILPYESYIFVYESSIPKALFVVNLGLVGFLLGYEIMGTRAGTQVVQEPLKIPNQSWNVMGIALMIIAVIMHVLSLLVVGMEMLKRYGYAAVQNIGEYTSYTRALFLSFSEPLMIVGAVIYLIVSALRYGKLFRSKLALGLFVTYLVIVVLEGNRGPVMHLCAPALLIRHYFIKRIRIGSLVCLFIATMFLFSAIGVVRKTIFAPMAMVEEYKIQRRVGYLAWTDPFVEMGASFLVVDTTCHEVPMPEPYWKGASWGAAVTHIVPFLQGFATQMGWIRWEPSKWLVETYYGRGRAGRGFSVAAEGYLNFGFIGAFLEVMFFGVFVRWLTVKFSKRPSAIWGIIMLGCLGQSLVMVRNHLNLVTNKIALIVVFAIFINLLLGSITVSQTEEMPLLDYETAS
jgi:hypothetical protein